MEGQSSPLPSWETRKWLSFLPVKAAAAGQDPSLSVSTGGVGAGSTVAAASCRRGQGRAGKEAGLTAWTRQQQGQGLKKSFRADTGLEEGGGRGGGTGRQQRKV